MHGCIAHVPSGHINLNGHKPAEVGDMHIQVDWDRSFILLHELGCFAAPYLSLRLEPWLVVHHVHLAPQRILLLVLEDEEVAVMCMVARTWHWGLGMCVLDVVTACLTCTTDASGVTRLVVRSNGSE